MRRVTGGLFRDLLGIKAHTGKGRAVMLTLPMLRSARTSALERKRWPSVVSHLAAGARLRSLGRSLSLESAPVEAVLDSDARLHHARGAATPESSRDRLREAVRRTERVRSRAGRADPDSALGSWDALVAGRWSLVDRFDTDGRRFVVAVKNDPEHADPRGLSAQERQVAEFVGLGHSNKEVAYKLGVSVSAVGNCSARAQVKLGLGSRAELAAFFAPCGLRAKLAEVSVAGENLLLGAHPLVDEARVDVLTEAERAVLANLLCGSTNTDIANRRNTSERTVANQVQSIYRKLRVRSRSELAAQLQSAA
jgi:DNA-binding NarL/FixJ family response regulator